MCLLAGEQGAAGATAGCETAVGDGDGGRSGDGTAAGGQMRDRNVQFSESAAP